MKLQRHRLNNATLIQRLLILVVAEAEILRIGHIALFVFDALLDGSEGVGAADLEEEDVS